MTHTNLARIGLGLALLLSAPATIFGQAVFGSIVGTVRDTSGAPIPGAKVTVVDTGKGISHVTTTNETGNYSQTHLIVGVYEVRVEVPAFDTFVQQNVTVEVDSVTQVNAQLTVGRVGESVNVTAETPLLKTSRSDVSDTFTQKQVMEIPVFARDINRVYFLVPGVQANSTTAASEQPQAIFRPKVNGGYWGGISFQLDGTDNRESVLGEPVVSPNLDAVSELKITTGAYDAEFGQANQAVIAIQTKSGSNSLHGGGFWVRRDDNGQARDPFSQSLPIVGTNNRFIPSTLWHQFGGSIGGPIQKDKTFFFGDYQGRRQRDGGSQLLFVPTAAERGGDLSALGTNIYNPCTADGSNCNLTPAQRTQFANNAIPNSLLSPQAQNLLKFIPLPNIPGVTGATPNYLAAGTAITNSDAFDVRVDRYQSEKLHMFGRYSLQQWGLGAPGAFGTLAGGPNFPGTSFSGTSSVRNQSLAYGIDDVLRPNWLADFRFGFFRYFVNVNPNGLGTSPATDAGIPGLNLDPYYTSGMPAITLSGFGGFSFGYSLPINQCNCPLNEQENQFQWVTNWTHIKGNHTIKFGADYRHAQNLRVPSDSHRAGQLTFAVDQTAGPNGGGLPLASFLLGNVANMQRYVSNSTNAAERQNREFFYVQDTWRITPRLTLNYGLRWEIYNPQYVNDKGNGGLVRLDTGEVETLGQNGVSLNGNLSTALTHFAPRLGIAYQITDKTVIRTGYGRSYDVGVFGTSFGHNVTQNLPVLAIQSFNPASSFLPVFSLSKGPGAIIDPTSILATQPKGPNGFPILPSGITPNVLPLTSDSTMRLPVVDSWNFTLERQISSSFVASVGYVGNKGTHVAPGGTNYNINQPSIVGFGTLSTIQRQYFYQRFGWSQSIKYFSDDATMHFNSLQARIEKRFSHGMQFQANYTWASAFDFATDYFFWNPKIDYGPEDGIRRHVFTANDLYELPFGKGRHFLNNASRPVDFLLGGWQLSGTWVYESGLPFTASYKNCNSDRDTGPCRPNQVGNAGVSNPSAQGWFATTGGVALAANGDTIGPWQRPQKGIFGNAPRNALHGPHLFNADASLMKSFAITEKWKAQFRAEAYNVFNHVNLGQPDSSVDNGTGGKIFALASLSQMRKWQLALRLDF
jgi:outer membrane receptor protein involved in Fe transport